MNLIHQGDWIQLVDHLSSIKTMVSGIESILSECKLSQFGAFDHDNIDSSNDNNEDVK